VRSRIVSFNELENIENNVEGHYDDHFNPASGLNSSVHSQGENFYGSGVYGNTANFNHSF
jgi:demethoxyubiquinone hydroxylase (CLK1/Coq7/Cat5 family)